MSDDLPEVRDEDAFDVAAVDTWLRGLQGLQGNLPPGPPQVRQFSSGASNLTYLLRYGDGNGALEWVLRRPPAGQKAASAHDMSREFTVQAALRPAFPFVPEMIGYCDDESVIGSQFYVMTRVPGLILHRSLPDGMALDPAQARALAQRVFDVLAQLHEVDPSAAGLGSLGRGPGYVRRQVEGWSGRFRAARTDNVPDFEAVMAWLQAHQPGDVAARLIHNDFRLDNVVLDGDLQVAAVLDWEMATVGDPLMDLGGALAYWVQADDDDMFKLSKRQPSDLPGMPTRAELLASYAARTGLPIDDWPFYEVFGLFRLAVIAQQIYLRFHLGQTTNPAFKDFWFFVTYLEERCRRLAGIAGAA